MSSGRTNFGPASSVTLDACLDFRHFVGKYEDEVAGNLTFDEGQLNGNDDFTTRDLVVLFQSVDSSLE